MTTEDVQWCITHAIVISVEESSLLIPVYLVISHIHVQNNLGVALLSDAEIKVLGKETRQEKGLSANIWIS